MKKIVIEIEKLFCLFKNMRKKKISSKTEKN